MNTRFFLSLKIYTVQALQPATDWLIELFNKRIKCQVRPLHWVAHFLNPLNVYSPTTIEQQNTVIHYMNQFALLRDIAVRAQRDFFIYWGSFGLFLVSNQGFISELANIATWLFRTPANSVPNFILPGSTNSPVLPKPKGPGQETTGKLAKLKSSKPLTGSPLRIFTTTPWKRKGIQYRKEKGKGEECMDQKGKESWSTQEWEQERARERGKGKAKGKGKGKGKNW
ncbi:hypothetical protein C7212DRAFT_346193 [Tuber magnatum]|uniref:Uncharacterized protein n=1 Tax=Tuber magnatum TaxID=42249 RepID=A0A317SIK9_9PEZI|nr:hypothetical protein C7212DRAFT_346193 [Tuber magnatum]